MAMSNGSFGPLWEAMGDNDKAIDLTADTLKWQTTSNTVTPDYTAWDEEADLPNEVIGTGYTTGGEALSTNTWTTSTGFQVLDCADISLPTTTLTNVRGMFTYDDTIVGDPLIHGVTFGADYSTVAGTFAITVNANGLLRIDFIP